MKNWELILFNIIIKSKNMDPWNINAKELASAYTKRINEMRRRGSRITKRTKETEKVLREMELCSKSRKKCGL